MQLIVLLIIGAFILFAIIYYAVRGAVSEGVLQALQEYDKLKDERENGNTNEQRNASD